MDPQSANPLLSDVATRLLRAHRPDEARPDRCAHPRCRGQYPCQTAQVALEAVRQAGTLGADAPVSPAVRHTAATPATRTAAATAR